MLKDVPIYSTKEETEEFNNWYLQKIGANSKTCPDAFSVEVQAKQDENLIPPVLGVSMDQEMDHAMSLPTPHTGNLSKESTSIHNKVTMEYSLVLFLAILKLIHFTKPNLSYVPAVFPTHCQPHPDPYVPSNSACDPFLAPVDMRLTGTSRQVVLSHVTKGYLPRLRVTVWEILQRGKISAGLRFMQVGAMLLS